MSQAKQNKKLPQWLSGLPKHKIPEKRKLPEDNSHFTFPELVFSGHITYSTNVDDCNLLCDDIINECELDSGPHVLGFDMEWPVTYTVGQEGKTALVQLCTKPSQCYLFHLAAMTEFPHMLKTLLLTDKVLLTGVGIEGDLWKLERNFDIQVLSIIKNRMIDLTVLANDILRSSERWSLDNLTQHLLEKSLNKDPVVRKCDWSKWPLTEQQQKYAATDAYVSLLLYNELQKRKEKR